MRYPQWTDEEKKYLINNWGVKSMGAIAKHLGKSYQAVQSMYPRLGLQSPWEYTDGIKVTDFAECLKVSPNMIRYRWTEKYGFPLKKKKLTKEKWYYYVIIDDFWEWAEKHKHVVNFYLIEKNILGGEPDWVDDMRRRDYYNISKSPKNRYWTQEDEDKLVFLLKQFKYSYLDLALMLKRTESSIKRKIENMGLPYRPIRAESIVEWTEEEERKAVEMVKEYWDLTYIAKYLNKNSGKAVEAKLRRMVKEGKAKEEELYIFNK